MYLSLAILLLVLLLLHLGQFYLLSKPKTQISSNHSSNVGKFYNETTDKFLAVYGEIIQAFRTQNVGDYLKYTAENMKLSEKKKALDAGCGVAGPACYFAENFPNTQITAISISDVQIGKAQEKILEKKLEKQIHAEVLDYHKIAQHFPSQSFDLVYFLESYGHSSNKKELLHGVWEVLEPGGSVYIKDLFKREVENEWEQAYVDKICSDIDKAYEYNIGTLYETLSILRKKGFIIRYMKTPDVPLAEFEHLSISNEFQNLFNIGKIDSWDDYVFPIDFFEILAEKPTIISDADKHLYFMNLTTK
jgi:ubiquinone/menaquinone biosynthesis C-methylase UbiE